LWAYDKGTGTYRDVLKGATGVLGRVFKQAEKQERKLLKTAKKCF